MNFFESQAQARAHSRRLAVLFLLATALIVAAVNAVIVVAVAAARAKSEHTDLVLQVDPVVALVATLITLGIVAGASLYRIAKLRSGGGAVARGLGARLIPAQSRDPKIRRLRNVVEEIAIASGVPVPEIYVLDGEAAINAFAAGFTPADAAITVTQGCLDKLSRDELQGVIAHEFSHVVNGDMRLSIRLMGVIFGILAITVIARAVLRASRRSRKGGGPIVLAALAIMLIGYIGVFFARLIKAGFSRERERLADASAVQFTRQTQGLAGALKKIAGIEAGSRLQSVDGEEVSHMLFGEGAAHWSLFATHPPLVERIRQLEPGFDPGQLAAVKRLWNDPGFVPDDSGSGAAIAGFAPGASVAAPQGAADLIASPGPAQFEQSGALLAALPPELKAAAEEPTRARCLVLALLLDRDDAVRARQLAVVDADLREAVAALHAQVLQLNPALRLPLAETAFPALRGYPREQLMALVATISKLTHADERVSLFEFCLGRMVRTFVADAMRPAKVAVAGRLKLAHCEAEVAGLLAALAQNGSASAPEARRAYSAGLSHALPRSAKPFQSSGNWPAQLDSLLRTLDGLNGPGKELLLEGLVRTASHDGRITLDEAELVRAICSALHCPLPPLAAG